MNSTEPKVHCPLVWEFDGHGEWSAISQVLDPDMTDQSVETWCLEWCLMWRIQVTEDGEFCCNESDKLLTECRGFIKICLKALDQVKGVIDLAEQENREMLKFRSGQPVHLLPADTYNNRRRTAVKLEVGKKYICRNGEVVGPMEDINPGTPDFIYPYSCRTSQGDITWTPDGRWKSFEEGEWDIICEYIEPAPPLQWKWMKPDRPGI